MVAAILIWPYFGPDCAWICLGVGGGWRGICIVIAAWQKQRQNCQSRSNVAPSVTDIQQVASAYYHHHHHHHYYPQFHHHCFQFYLPPPYQSKPLQLEWNNSSFLRSSSPLSNNLIYYVHFPVFAFTFVLQATCCHSCLLVDYPFFRLTYSFSVSSLSHFCH